MIRLALTVLVLCFLPFAAHAQSCGTWLPGPATPDLPSGIGVTMLRNSGSDVLALTNSGTQPLWRLRAAQWSPLPWDTAALGTPTALSTENASVTIATWRLVSSQSMFINGQFVTINTIEIAVRSLVNEQWQTLAEYTREYGASQSNTIVDLSFFGGKWYAAIAFRSSSSFLSSSYSGSLYRVDTPALTHLASTNSTGCTLLCLDPARISALRSTPFGLFIGGRWDTLTLDGGTTISNSANLIRYDGTSFSALTNLPNAGVRGLAYYAGINIGSERLVAWGNFSQVGTLSASRIALRNLSNGTWSALGAGLDASPDAVIPIQGNQSALDIDLLALGAISSGGTGLTSTARWTGTAWEPFAVNALSGNPVTATLSGGVIVGGSSLSIGSRQLFGVARYVAPTWSPVASQGTDAQVLAVGVHNAEVIAAGEFTRMDGVPALRIARRSGQTWQPLGSGLDGPAHAVLSFNGELIAAGAFTNAGGVPVSNIAAWNGTTWRSLGSGLNGTVRALTNFNGSLVAVGSFTASNLTSTPRAARWTGSAWVALDPAFASTDLFAAATYAGQLYVGGANLWRLNGSTFQLVSGGVGGNVRALHVVAGSLYVGGDFFTVGGAANLGYKCITRYNGTQFFAVGSNSPSDFNFGSVSSVFSSADRLYIAGNFSVTTSTPTLARNVAALETTQWLALQTGDLDQAVNAGTTLNETVWLGGTFLAINNAAAGQPLTSAYLAQWSRYPLITSHPAPVEICDTTGNATAMFSVVAPGATQYRWHRNGTPLSDNLRISGALTPVLSIGGVIPADEGAYTCIVSDTCLASLTSNPAMLTVGCCVADFNNSGVLEPADIFEYLNAWFMSDPRADINGGGIQPSDIFDFLNAWFIGCP